MRDGDTGIPRKLDLSIVGDTENFFELENLGHSEDGILSASLKKTSGNTLDRELPVRQRSTDMAQPSDHEDAPTRPIRPL